MNFPCKTARKFLFRAFSSGIRDEENRRGRCTDLILQRYRADDSVTWPSSFIVYNRTFRPIRVGKRLEFGQLLPHDDSVLGSSRTARAFYTRPHPIHQAAAEPRWRWSSVRDGLRRPRF